MTDDLPNVLKEGDLTEDPMDRSNYSHFRIFLCEATSDDYAVVSSLLDSKAEAPLVNIAGIVQLGTL